METFLNLTYKSHTSTATGQNASLRAAISVQALLVLRVSLCLAATAPSNDLVLQTGEACISAFERISVYDSDYVCVCVCESGECFSITLSACCLYRGKSRPHPDTNETRNSATATARASQRERDRGEEISRERKR